MKPVRSEEIIVIGGGLIGLTIARELAAMGRRVAVLERGRIGQGASQAAAGMLAAQVECRQPDAFFRLALTSRSMYRSWAEELAQEAGFDIGYRSGGILRVALDEQEAAELKQRGKWQQDYGLQAEWIPEKELPARQKHLSALLHGGLFVAGDHQVDSIRLCKALHASVLAKGVHVAEQCCVLQLLRASGRVCGVRTEQGDWHAEQVVLAAGAWSGQVRGRIPLAPVRGEIIEAAAPFGFLETVVFHPGCYFVPKTEQRLLIGATEEEDGFDSRLRLGGIHALLEQAARIVPASKSLSWRKARAGLRPATPDRLPLLGPDPEIENLCWACGHYRNGVLLTPVTGRLIAQILCGRKPVADWSPFAPARYFKDKVV